MWHSCEAAAWNGTNILNSLMQELQHAKVCSALLPPLSLCFKFSFPLSYRSSILQLNCHFLNLSYAPLPVLFLLFLPKMFKSCSSFIALYKWAFLEYALLNPFCLTFLWPFSEFPIIELFGYFHSFFLDYETLSVKQYVNFSSSLYTQHSFKNATPHKYNQHQNFKKLN